MAKDTRTDLVVELGTRRASPAWDALMLRAIDGAYHCFESESATPKVDLVRDLEAAGFPDLAARVRAGEFDERPTAAQSAALRALLIAEGGHGPR